LDKELKENMDSFGVIEIDNRDFTRDQIIRKWEEQGRIDFYDGQPLDNKKLVGDHYIPRSWGKKKGGVTEYDNLVVTSKSHNLKKLNMSGDEYKSLLN
jgi:5-methylcytosine-specific restriction endonuclease McrA